MSYLSDLLGEQYKEGMSEDELSAALEAAVPELTAAATKKVEAKWKGAVDKATAKALVDGDFDTVTKNQQAFLSSYKDAIIADQMKHMSKPTGGTIGSVDYNKKIEEANAAGDVTAVAYYTRLAGQAAATE